ncbi:hypothetical protein [Methylobacterium sp. JK268]
MAEPETLVLEHLGAIRASVDRLEQRADRLESRGEARFGAIEDRLDGRETRIVRLEADPI